ncbi:hypothetical protein ACTMU2_40370 [Cupriavidus basilensis]
MAAVEKDARLAGADSCGSRAGWPGAAGGWWSARLSIETPAVKVVKKDVMVAPGESRGGYGVLTVSPAVAFKHQNTSLSDGYFRGFPLRNAANTALLRSNRSMRIRVRTALLLCRVVQVLSEVVAMPFPSPNTESQPVRDCGRSFPQNACNEGAILPARSPVSFLIHTFAIPLGGVAGFASIDRQATKPKRAIFRGIPAPDYG